MTERPLLGRTYLIHAASIALGAGVVTLASRQDLGLLIGIAVGAFIVPLPFLGLIRRRTIEVTETDIIGPTRFKRIRIPLADVNAAATRETFGTFRITSNRDEVIYMNKDQFNRDQRNRVRDVVLRSAI